MRGCAQNRQTACSTLRTPDGTILLVTPYTLFLPLRQYQHEQSPTKVAWATDNRSSGYPHRSFRSHTASDPLVHGFLPRMSLCLLADHSPPPLGFMSEPHCATTSPLNNQNISSAPIHGESTNIKSFCAARRKNSTSKDARSRASVRYSLPPYPPRFTPFYVRQCLSLSLSLSPNPCLSLSPVHLSCPYLS